MRSSAVVVGLAVAAVLAGCTAGPTGSTPTSGASDDDSAATTGRTSGSPIVFALHCGGRTYTTYDAAWDARQDSCTVTRLSGDEPSAQQAAAVAVADGSATLEELAATCAEVGSAPWTGHVDDTVAAHRAEALLRYCPGHPEADRLQDAIGAWRD